MPKVTTQVAIDWWNNGGADDVTNDIRQAGGITVETGKDGARPRNLPMVPSADIVLDNRDGRYTPVNAGSDIYPYVLPDRPITIAMAPEGSADVTYEDASITYEDDVYYEGIPWGGIFAGFTDEPTQDPSLNAQLTQIRSLGRSSMIRGRTVSTQIYTDIRTDTAVGYILDAIGWPDGDRAISTGDTTMDWWWLDDADAWDALMQLLQTEGTGASLYEDGAGVLHFENRNYRVIETRSTTSQATFGVGESMGFTEFTYQTGMREVFNDVSMTIHRRAQVAVAQVWEVGTTLTLSGNETRVLRAHLDDPSNNVQDVTVGTDYVVDAGSLTVVTTFQESAQTVVITFVAGGSGATVNGPASATTGPRLRAYLVSVVSEERVTQTAAASTHILRTRSLDLNEAGVRPEIALPTAEALVDVAVEYYRDARPSISIELVNRDAARLDEIINRMVSDRITVTAGPNQFQGDIWIERLHYAVTHGGIVVRMGITGSQAVAFTETPGLWDTASWDVSAWGT